VKRQTNVLLVFGLLFCSPPRGQAPTRGLSQAHLDAKDADGQNNKELRQKQADSKEPDEPQDKEPTEEKVDPKELRIFALRAGSLEDKRTLHEVVSYEVSGKADYVYYKICPKDGQNKECVENIYTMDRLILPVLLAGTIQISVRACVDEERALDPKGNCGPWEEKLHDTHRYSPEVGVLLQEKDRIIQRLRVIETDYRAALIAFQKESKECVDRDAGAQKLLDSKLKFIDLVLEAPFGWIADTVTMQANNIVDATGTEKEVGAVGDALKGLGSKISDFFGEKCASMGEEMCGYAHMAKDMGAMMARGMFNPVDSVGMLSNAMHDLAADPKDLVKRNCYAEASLQLRQDAMDRLWIQSRDRLKKIKEELDSKEFL
jgi:hypothetical protein